MKARHQSPSFAFRLEYLQACLFSLLVKQIEALGTSVLFFSTSLKFLLLEKLKSCRLLKAAHFDCKNSLGTS